jgi:hypothetical protein
MYDVEMAFIDIDDLAVAACALLDRFQERGIHVNFTMQFREGLSRGH